MSTAIKPLGEIKVSPNRQKFLESLNITDEQFKLLSKNCTGEELMICIELLKAKSHRSPYRATMHKLVRDWLNSTTLKSKPLSPAQFQRAKPSWPLNTVIPH